MNSQLTVINRLIEEIKGSVYISVMPKDYTFVPSPATRPTHKQVNTYCNSRQKKQSKGKQ